MTGITHPLILTLTLNEEAHLFLTSIRNKYFPADRNFLEAHLTLFHHLPFTDTILSSLKEIIRPCPVLSLHITEVVFTGRGVAYKVICPSLLQLHKKLQTEWQAFLIPQDKARLWPHITVQNKVAPHVARKTRDELQETFIPFTAYGIGVTVWEYLDGPWKKAETLYFT